MNEAIKINLPDMEVIKINKRPGGDLFILLTNSEYDEITEGAESWVFQLLEKYGIIIDKEEFHE